jgi:thioesterase domain-containing protein/acyl carrier protein
MRARLPEHMVPSAYMALDRLPLTSSGKIDRRGLPPPLHLRTDEHRAPRTPGESRLAAIWEDLLHVSPIGATEDFFEVGGHSLLATTLMARIEQEFGRKLPLSVLFEEATIEGLARLLEGAASPDGMWAPIATIQQAVGRLPFFCDLAIRLGSDQPMYGLQAPEAGTSGGRHDRLDRLAAHYLDEMRRIQAVGPYFLGGMSFGGFLALEIARQLRRSGESVGLVALFDTWGPGYPRRVPFGRRLRRHLSAVRQRSSSQAAAYLTERLRGRTRLLGERVRWQVHRLRRRLNAEATPAWVHNRSMLATYQSEAYDGPIVLFRAREQPDWALVDPFLGWHRVLPRDAVEVYEVPDNHETLLRPPDVDHLAAVLRGCLDRAQELARV